MKQKWKNLLPLLILLCLAACRSSPQKTEAVPGPENESRTMEETVPSSSAEPVSQQLTDRWMNGDLSDLAGHFRAETEDPEVAADLQAIRDDFAIFEKETEAEEEGILGLLSPYTRVTLPEVTSADSFPLDVPMTVTTPDIAAILTALHYETYEDGEKLTQDLAAELKKGGFPERTITVTVTLEKDGEVCYAGENREAYFAFYGGLTELYRQAYTEWLEAVGGVLGGQE